MRRCVIFSNGIGDGVMALPALRRLGQAAYDILLLTDQEFIDRWRLELKHIRCVPLKFTRSDGRRYFDVPRALEAAQGRPYLISLSTWTSTSMASLATHFEHSVGHFPEFETYIPYNSEIHAIDNAFRLAGGDPRDLFDYSRPLRVHPAQARFSHNFWKCTHQNSCRILVHVETAPGKQPNPKWLARYLDCIAEQVYNHCFVVISAFEDTKAPPCIRCDLLCVSGMLFDQAVALIRDCDFFIGVDSCFLHVADFFRKPGAALFVSTSPLEYGWRFSSSGICISANYHDMSEASTPDVAANCTVRVLENTVNVRRKT